MSSKLIAAWHLSRSIFRFSSAILKLSDGKKNLNLIFCNRFYSSPCWSPEEHSIYFFSFSLVFFLRIFLTPDTFSFKFDWAVIMALTSSLERRGVMPLRSDASGTLRGSWQGWFPRLWSDDLLPRVDVCTARKFLQPWLRALGLLPALWIRVHSVSVEDG